MSVRTVRSPLLILITGILAAIAPAQSGGREQTIQLGDRDEQREIRYSIRSTPGDIRGGGYTYVEVTVVHDDPEVDAHNIGIETKIEGYDNVLYARATTELTLARGDRRTVVLPMANIGNHRCVVRVSVAGSDSSSSVSAVSNSQFGQILLLTDDGEWTKAWTFAPRAIWKGATQVTETRIGRRRRQTSTRPNFNVIERDLTELPDRWQWLTGISWIAVDGRMQNFGADDQTLLLDWLVAGGSLVVTHTDALPAGPLRAKLGNVRRAGGRVAGRHGFGRFYATAGAALVENKFSKLLEGWLRDERSGFGPMAGKPRIGPIPRQLQQAQSVPSLGEPPVTLFFILIVTFVLLAGPLNYLWATRKKQPVLMAFTVPALGLVFTAGILLWGLVSEGFGIRGTIQSITRLDQRTNEAAHMTNRTLYAASSPGDLTPAPTTWLGNLALDGSRRLTSAAALEQRIADGQVTFSGRAVPARTETPLLTIENTAARERLRFRRSGDGYEVIADSDFAPVPTAGSIVLRTADGYFRSDATGRLEPVEAPTNLPTRAQLLSTIIQQLSTINRSPAVQPGGVADWLAGNRTNAEFAKWVESLLTLPENGYIALVSSVPSLDPLGLPVDYERKNHVVIGQLAKDDLDD